MPARAALLLSLSLAFLLRVAGQLAVFVAQPAWLPPFEAWHSGLLPYPALFTAQLAILALQAGALAAVWRGRGRFASPGPRTALALHRFALLYGAVMVARYPLTMALSPENRWSGGTIPIAFHLVLAAWILVYAAPAPAATAARR
jgi:hypothetical protein